MEKHHWNAKIECMTREELTALQEMKLGNLFRYVMENSPFFRRKLDRAHIDVSHPVRIQHLLEIAPTTREELVEDQLSNPPFGSFPCVTLDKAAAIGQTGIGFSISGYRLTTMATHSDVNTQGALLMRNLWEGGVRPTHKVYVADDPRYNLILIYMTRAICDINAVIVYVANERSKRNAQFTARAIPPNHYFLTPTYAHYLAGVIKQEQEKPLPIQSIFGWGEPGFSIPTKRKIIQQRWEAISSSRPFRIFDIYAMSEAGVLAGACKKGYGLHGFEDSVIYEVLDPNSDRVLDEGERGELVITHLTCGAMPLIRYRTGDLVTLDRSPCECGRTHIRLCGIDRLADTINVAGQTIFADDVEEILHQEDQLVNFRIVKEGDSMEALKVLLTDRGILKSAETNLRKRFNVPVEVELRDVNSLPPYIHRNFRVFYPERNEVYQEIYNFQSTVE